MKCYYGHSLQFCVQVVALINLIWTALLIIAEITIGSTYGPSGVRALSAELSEDVSSDQNTQCTYHVYYKYSCTSVSAPAPAANGTATVDMTMGIFVSLVWISSWMIDIGFSVLLYRAATLRNRGNCRVWFYFRLWVLLFRILFLSLYALLGLSLLTKIPVMIFFTYRIYSLWIVRKFIEELSAAKEPESEEAKTDGKSGTGQAEPIPQNQRSDSNVSEYDMARLAYESKKKALRTARRTSSPFLVFNV